MTEDAKPEEPQKIKGHITITMFENGQMFYLPIGNLNMQEIINLFRSVEDDMRNKELQALQESITQSGLHGAKRIKGKKKGGKDV